MHTFPHVLADGHIIELFVLIPLPITISMIFEAPSPSTVMMLLSNIWDWCLEHKSWITCSHILGQDDNSGNLASRIITATHE